MVSIIEGFQQVRMALFTCGVVYLKTFVVAETSRRGYVLPTVSNYDSGFL